MLSELIHNENEKDRESIEWDVEAAKQAQEIKAKIKHLKLQLDMIERPLKEQAERMRDAKCMVQREWIPTIKLPGGFKLTATIKHSQFDPWAVSKGETEANVMLASGAYAEANGCTVEEAKKIILKWLDTTENVTFAEGALDVEWIKELIVGRLKPYLVSKSVSKVGEKLSKAAGSHQPEARAVVDALTSVGLGKRTSPSLTVDKKAVVK